MSVIVAEVFLERHVSAHEPAWWHQRLLRQLVLLEGAVPEVAGQLPERLIHLLRPAHFLVNGEVLRFLHSLQALRATV